MRAFELKKNAQMGTPKTTFSTAPEGEHSSFSPPGYFQIPAPNLS
jgi:hypothetical protein